MSRRRSLVVLALLLALPVLAAAAACAPGGGTDKVIGGPAHAEEPTRVVIPAIGVASPLFRLGRNGDDPVPAPPPDKGMTAGWYTDSAAPGTRGAAVIIGHDDTSDGKAVFRDLDKVTEGTAIDVERGDGTVLHFSVTGTEKTATSDFPVHRVFGETPEKALRLVTCTGGHGPHDDRPAENFIVYATLRG
ncbi:sortase [Streptomyces cinnamoneus]|uniref:sortase domain-containing protein n=1 Tax=Streptomyces cinnamoneus TaxID=53446 RepID=UPI0034280BC8